MIVIVVILSTSFFLVFLFFRLLQVLLSHHSDLLLFIIVAKIVFSLGVSVITLLRFFITVAITVRVTLSSWAFLRHLLLFDFACGSGFGPFSTTSTSASWLFIIILVRRQDLLRPVLLHDRVN